MNDLSQIFKESGNFESGVLNLEKISPDEKTEREHLIVCRFCGNRITSSKSIIQMNGSHTHTFSNPSGNTFVIGCFLTAEGCLNYGELTSAFTWFPGFCWCFALCSVCFSHLGWCYTSSQNSFYGLILSHLSENF